ncbi:MULTISPECIES: NAD-dependent epimerase/dehydratase family protein [unclassified Rathayibacter]|uniref:NAD-dependent epimerase/dehydratase family protein n=1 Tax=unclassified Rathayibacter TaxID=2609250 RepID=UPI0007001662|nr:MULTISPECIES: NAD-dependent epimerase/dehydratase family protein [unclassified Rathayibacter]KQP97661.1 UDP-glucose 4-epimerase [Rathayibacter sp. Leaf294]KQS07334.1 UDP-glucose 4-epimerase [Rathayibacter sp. Leaf185]
MKALVTGAAGFIGSTISRRLLADGWDVVGIDAFTDYYDVALKRTNAAANVAAGLDLVEADLTEIELPPLLDGVDVVFHQAGQPGVRGSWKDGFAPYLTRNIGATQRLLEALRDHDRLQRFVYASSSSIYGDAESFPTAESTTPAPVSPYGVTKLAAEHLTSLYGTNFGLPTTSLRYFTVYGPRQRPDMAFTRFVKAAVLGDRIEIYGTGEQIRDFTFVDDIVEANVLAATTATAPGSVYNVAGGTSASVNEVLEFLGEVNGSPLNVSYTDAALGDVVRTGGATERIAAELGWAPKVDLKDGLSRHLAWARETFGDTA